MTVQHTPECAIHGCEGWNGDRFCDCGADKISCHPCEHGLRPEDCDLCAPEFDRINHGPFEHPVSEPDDDQVFIRNLEARHMSSWTDAEMNRYNKLTGQE